MKRFILWSSIGFSSFSQQVKRRASNLPTAIGAKKVAMLIIFPNAADLLESLTQQISIVQDLGILALEFNELLVEPNSTVIDVPISELESDNSQAFLIVGIRSPDNSCQLHPPGDTKLKVGDTVIFLGHSEQLPCLIKRLAALSPEMIYRGIRSTR